MPVQQIPAGQASSSLASEILERDGCVVLTGITVESTRAELLRELEAYVRPTDPREGLTHLNTDRISLEFCSVLTSRYLV